MSDIAVRFGADAQNFQQSASRKPPLMPNRAFTRRSSTHTVPQASTEPDSGLHQHVEATCARQASARSGEHPAPADVGAWAPCGDDGTPLDIDCDAHASGQECGPPVESPSRGKGVSASPSMASTSPRSADIADWDLDEEGLSSQGGSKTSTESDTNSESRPERSADSPGQSPVLTVGRLMLHTQLHRAVEGRPKPLSRGRGEERGRLRHSSSTMAKFV